jgi:hypothetical protein
MDWSEVRRIQFLILVGSALIFPVYAMFLLFFSTLLLGIILYSAYLTTQIPVGLILTRYYQGLGALAKAKLNLLDPIRLRSDWDSSHQVLHTGEVSRVFDDISVKLQKFDPSVDDVIDLTWFGVIVWAVLSTAIIAVFNPLDLFFASPSLVLAGLCLVNLYNGYRAASLKSFEDVIEHLKYLVLSRISAMHAAAGKRYFQPGIRWLMKGKQKALADITIQILNESREVSGTICYWLGLSSKDAERMAIDIHEDQVSAIQTLLTNHPIVSKGGWKVASQVNGDMSRVVLSNERNAMRIDRSSTIVLSPSRVRDTSQNLADALTAIILALERK